MIGWLCHFAAHKWLHHFNALMRREVGDYKEFGIYQCKRCKSISVGSPR